METTKITPADKLKLQDLILHRVHEILLVASPYDHFVLEEDGRLTEQILHEYMGMDLSNAPRVWPAYTASNAFKMISRRKYDLVIVMMRLQDMPPLVFAAKIKEKYSTKPVILLAFDESEIKQLPKGLTHSTIDKVFIWSGNANVFLAIVKYLEDRMNVKRDVKKGDVRCILFIEDSPRFYSTILPMIYKEITYHMKSLVEKSLNDTERMLHKRGRPKILLASTYEEAEEVYKHYRTHMLGIISDIRFPRGGKPDPMAGGAFIEWVRKLDPHMPIMLQSRHLKNRELAEKLHTHFLHKESPTLLQDLREFIVTNFGFGDFIFRNEKNEIFFRATDLPSLLEALKTIPDESLVFHANSNHFSNWLAARGEFQLASQFRPLQVSDFKRIDDLRELLQESIEKTIRSKRSGLVIEFSGEYYDAEETYTRLAPGSLGGKARGLAFVNSLLFKSDLRQRYPGVMIRVPKVAVIGTDAFDQFMDENKLWDVAFKNISNRELERAFLKAPLPESLVESLKSVLAAVRYPLAVRSSSMLEDSQYQPLAGLYATYMLPNNSPSEKRRLKQLCEAVKRVYASTFFQEPKSFIGSSIHRQMEEKMAVIIMELIGRKYGSRFYPVISGTALSLNYYPVSYMKRDEGVAHLALGLGRTVVEGGKALRISPKYPTILPQYYSVKATLNNSQNSFFALDLNKRIDPLKGGVETNLRAYPLSVAEEDGTLAWCGSVVSIEDDVIRDSLQYPGTRVITFAPILKWHLFPLPEILVDLLQLGKEGLGCEVELEFAVNLYEDKSRKPEFYLLQIRPMVSTVEVEQGLKSVSKEEILCHSSLTLGNGTMVNIQDIVFVDPHRFRASKTMEIAQEVEAFNRELGDERPYLLIGPGRWGSADPWLGIPVNWNQINHARVIVELGLEHLPIDPSFGSHFFQNITSMRLGYFTVDLVKNQDWTDFPWLQQQPVVKKGRYTTWFHTDKPLLVNINGQTGEGLIIKPSLSDEEVMNEQEASGI